MKNKSDYGSRLMTFSTQVATPGGDEENTSEGLSTHKTLSGWTTKMSFLSAAFESWLPPLFFSTSDFPLFPSIPICLRHPFLESLPCLLSVMAVNRLLLLKKMFIEEGRNYIQRTEGKLNYYNMLPSTCFCKIILTTPLQCIKPHCRVQASEN